MSAGKLSPKQECFCQEYLKDLNATQAAIRAGYSEHTAQEQSSRLLSKAIIKERIDALMQKREKRTEITADKILYELYRLATADVTQAFDEMGQLKPLKEIPEDLRRSISGLEVNEIFSGQGEDKVATGLAKKVRFWDKPKALELLGKHLKLFAERFEHSGPDGKPIETKEVSDLTPEERQARIKELQAKLNGKAGA